MPGTARVPGQPVRGPGLRQASCRLVFGTYLVYLGCLGFLWIYVCYVFLYILDSWQVSVGTGVQELIFWNAAICLGVESQKLRAGPRSREASVAGTARKNRNASMELINAWSCWNY